MRLKLDIIVSASPPVTGVAKDATVTIPIVMAHDPDPVGNGLSPALRDLVGTSPAWPPLPLS